MSRGLRFAVENHTPEAVAVVSFAKDLADAAGGQQKFAAFTGSWDLFGEENPIAAEQLGGTLFEQWYLGLLAEASPKVDIMVRPFSTRDGEPLSYAGGLAFAVPTGAENPDAAFAFGKFMSRTDTWVAAARASKKEAQAAGGVYSGTYTGNREADERIFDEVYEPSGNQAFDDAVETVLDVQEQAVSVPANPAGAEVKQAWQDGINEVLLGRAPATSNAGTGSWRGCRELSTGPLWTAEKSLWTSPESLADPLPSWCWAQ